MAPKQSFLFSILFIFGLMNLCQGFLIAWALPTFNSMAITDTTELLSVRSMSKSGCSFNLDTSSPKNPPHLINARNEIIHPVLQQKKRIIDLGANQQMVISCPGNGNKLKATGIQNNEATCVSDSSVKIGGQRLGYFNLECSSAVKETLKEVGSCTGGTRIEIGWQKDTDFINQITICHDKSNANTLYAIDTIVGASINADDESNKRPSFRKANYYAGIDVETAYSQAGQMNTMSRIVASDQLVSQYINVSKSYYFARGHFSPDGDFIDAASQDATYYYINVAPQWQSFNNGNWKSLEIATRNLAASRSTNLITYTGGHGILTLADAKGVQKPIYLAFDSNGKGLIPVPKYYWKIVHDSHAERATVFIGVNNPHISSIPAVDIFCKDVCDEIPWVSWNRQKISSGYMFCCNISDFHRVVSHDFNLSDLPLLV